MSKTNYDFAGWATKNDILCSDGRVIKKDAFKDNDGGIVPLVFNHDHKDLNSVVGHALLENRDKGVYAYCKFNNTPNGKNAKEMVRNGDIRCLSIYANQLRQAGANVIHGCIREVSLVLAGANAGAFIDTVIEHSDDHDEEAIIYHEYGDDSLELYHEDEHSDDQTEGTEEGSNSSETSTEEGASHSDNTEEDSNSTANSTEEGSNSTENGTEENNTGNNDQHVSHSEETSDDTIEEVLKTFNDKQLTVLYFLIGKAIEEQADKEQNKETKDAEHSEKENNMEDQTMKTNIFENGAVRETRALAHSALNTILDNAKNGSCEGSLKKSYKAYCEQHTDDNEKDIMHAMSDELALAHSITNIGELFPDAKSVGGLEVLNQNEEWVDQVLNATKHTPFAKVKSQYMDITAATARAKGYVKGTRKAEEVVAAFKRTTNPQTIYKLQKLDRDDVLDIIDFDVVAWLKGEMRGKLNAELARAILIGDGRAVDDNDKIDPLCIRPVLGDNDVYTIPKYLTRKSADTDYTFAKETIREMIKARKEYKGSGKPTLYCSQDFLTNCLLIEDTNGRCIYENVEQLKTKLMVKDIVDIEVFNNHVRHTETFDYKLIAVMVNLADYNIGTNKGGQVTMFDDFDINFNKYEYLIETRCSGALVKPKSAISFEEKVAVTSNDTENEADGE